MRQLHHADYGIESMPKAQLEKIKREADAMQERLLIQRRNGRAEELKGKTRAAVAIWLSCEKPPYTLPLTP